MRQEKDTAKEIVRMLDESVEHMDARIVAKLADARYRAVAAVNAHAMPIAGAPGLLRIFSNYIHHHRAMMMSAVVLCTILMAFVLTQQFYGQEAMEQGDAFLLASELPPQAYLDKGFNTWLEQVSQH